MIHFKYKPTDKRYLYLLCDNTEDEMMKVYDKSIKDYVNVHVMTALMKHINLVNPLCYLPANRNKPPYTEDFLFEYKDSTNTHFWYCSIGLWQDIWIFLRDNNIPYDGLDPVHFKRNLKHTFEEFKGIVDSWGMSMNPRDYQYEAAYKILQWNQSISKLATRAGKTLVSYMVFRYCKEYLGAHNILMIVPSRDLVKQAYNDFTDYKEFFKIETVFGGGHMFETSNLTVGTFQSLIMFLDRRNKKYNPHYFDKFDIVFCDENHRATANQISTIIKQPFMLNVKIAFGMTGTLPEPKTVEHYGVHALLGAKIQTITPHELMEAGYISGIQIHQCRLYYDDPVVNLTNWIKCAEYSLSDYEMKENAKNPKRKEKIELPPEKQQFLLRHVKTMPFGITTAKDNIANRDDWSKIKKTIAYRNILETLVADAAGSNLLAIERMMVHFMPERIQFLLDEVLPNCTNNTLILAHHTIYIEHLTKLIEEKFGKEKLVMKIVGAVSDKKRDKIKQTLKEHNNCILVASYGCMSTGITLANLCYGVLFESFKSNTVNMQSIGRGLGLSDLKEKYILYDFVDCFDTNYASNKIFLQGMARTRIYKNEENQYPYDVITKHYGTKNPEYEQARKELIAEQAAGESKKKTKKTEPQYIQTELFI